MEFRRKQENDIATARGVEPMSDQAIMEEVLGHRSGYRRGFGYGMPIEPQSVSYYEQPRDEDFTHSEWDRTACQQQMQQMNDKINMLMSYVRPPPMSSYGQYPPSQQSAPHMDASGSGSDPSQPGFTPFTPAAPHPYPYPYPYPGLYGMSGQPSMYAHPPHDPAHGSPGSAGQPRGQPPFPGYTPQPGTQGFAQFSSQAPQFGSYAFPGSAPAAAPSSSHCPPQTPPPPPVYIPTPPSNSPSAMAHISNVSGSVRGRQRQHVRR